MSSDSALSARQAKVDTPYISAAKNLPEITIKAVVLGVLLAMLLAGSNAYLGLKIGTTVSACIPAAVISMAVLRFFRNSNILENNLVQTIASAGEVVAAGVIFTLPALVLMGFWKGFPYLQTTAIAVIGGALGVLFSVPLRRTLIVESKLVFPEGVATAEVLKAGEQSGDSTVKDLVFGGCIAASIKFLQSGFQIVGEEVVKWAKVGSTVMGFGTGLAPVVMSAGYIVGLRISISLFIGTAFTWLVALPIVSSIYGVPEGVSIEAASMGIWSGKLRYIGVGAMVVGGIWALISLIKPIITSIKTSFAALQHARDGEGPGILRTEHDIPMTWVVAGTLALAIPAFILFTYIIDVNDMPVSDTLFWITTSFITLVALICGFICASIAGYMAGIIGSSSNPLSGVTITAILVVSLVLAGLLGTQVDFTVHTDDALSAAATAVIIGAVVACAAAIGCDNLQDLKTGHIVGATPWKQEAMLIVGVLAGAMVITPILQLLYEAYGMGGAFPREGMDPTQSLAAPQATLMASVSKGVFLGGLPWNFLLIGAVCAVGLIILNKVLENVGSTWNFPVLAVALGLYLPFYVTISFFIGGVLKDLTLRAVKRKQGQGLMSSDEGKKAEKRGMLFASGAIAGEALMGILLAIPFALYQTTDVFALKLGMGSGLLMLSGIVVVGWFLHFFYKTATQAK